MQFGIINETDSWQTGRRYGLPGTTVFQKKQGQWGLMGPPVLLGQEGGYPRLLGQEGGYPRLLGEGESSAMLLATAVGAATVGAGAFFGARQSPAWGAAGAIAGLFLGTFLARSML